MTVAGKAMDYPLHAAVLEYRVQTTAHGHPLMLQFDARTRRIIDFSYAGSDVTDRRLLSFRALDPRPGETILDLGCGQGLLTADVARAVGDDGHVTGVDPSPDMRDGAVATCTDFPAVTIADGDAHAIPAPDARYDKAVSLQVLEYVPDMPAALTELHRVLRPGGRVVIGDTAWSSFCMHTTHPARMARMRASWDRHLAHPDLPAQLPGYLSEAGFPLDRVVPMTYTDTVLRTDGMGRMLLHLMASYAARNDHLSPAEVTDWQTEQTKLAHQGRFFFALSHFAFVAHRA